MAPDDAVSLITELALGDPWWRRAAAYKAMKRSPEHAWESALREAYTRYRDEEALAMLMRRGGNPLELCKDGLGDTLATLRYKYRRSLVLQQVLVRDERLALELGRRFGTPLAWAIGRSRFMPLKAFVVDEIDRRLTLCVDAATVLEFIDAAADVGLLCWAIARVGGVDELLAVAQRFGISELLEEH